MILCDLGIVAADLNEDLLVETGRIVAHDMASRFGLPRPRLAFAGLNPHAGEEGNIGREEIEIIDPAARALLTLVATDPEGALAALAAGHLVRHRGSLLRPLSDSEWIRFVRQKPY